MSKRLWCIECLYRVPAPCNYFISGIAIHRKCLVTRIVRHSIIKVWGKEL